MNRQARPAGPNSSESVVLLLLLIVIITMVCGADMLALHRRMEQIEHRPPIQVTIGVSQAEDAGATMHSLLPALEQMGWRR